MRNVSARGRDDCFSAATTCLRNVPPMVNKATSPKTGITTARRQVKPHLRLRLEMDIGEETHKMALWPRECSKHAIR
jgi:hypothetical protein